MSDNTIILQNEEERKLTIENFYSEESFNDEKLKEELVKKDSKHMLGTYVSSMNIEPSSELIKIVANLCLIEKDKEELKKKMLDQEAKSKLKKKMSEKKTQKKQIYVSITVIIGISIYSMILLPTPLNLFLIGCSLLTTIPMIRYRLRKKRNSLILNGRINFKFSKNT